MKTQENKCNFRWQRIRLAIAFGAVAVILTGIAVDRWRVRNGWCVRFLPNRQQKVFYGDDCWKSPYQSLGQISNSISSDRNLC
ncbi:hypothetical protein [uncultured Nostoc sp.]|uniref:hypothetical protein n=1 Tax=uncultured Nostoc sp. TaxID=340711 RepID=UPI0035CA1EC5